MALQPLRSRILPLLGYALLYASALAGIWLATAVVLSSAEQLMQPYGTQVPSPYDLAFHVYFPLYQSVTAIGFLGAGLLLIALLGRGPARLVSASQKALAILAGALAILSIYLLSCGGIAYKLAGGGQMRETRFYKAALDEFALLEAAQGRYEKLQDAFRKSQGMKMVEVRNVSEFSREEAIDRINALIRTLSTVNDPASKRQILATLALFRDRVLDYPAREVPRHAVEAGAPPTKSPKEALEWVAANLNKDGWEPLPLFKLGR